MSFGAPVFEQNADGSYAPELALGGEGGTAFAEWLAEQGEAGNLSTDVTYDIAVAAFAKGESPFIVGGPWMLEQFADLDLSIDPIPSAGGEPAQPFVGVAGFYVSAQSENALLANDFLVNYMATPEAQLALYEAGDRPPALIEAADTASEDPIIAGFREVGADAVPMPSLPEMGAVWAYWGVTEAADHLRQVRPGQGLGQDGHRHPGRDRLMSLPATRALRPALRSPGFLVKLVLIALVDALGVYAVLAAWGAGSWGILAAMVALLLVANWAYFTQARAAR